MHRILQRYHVAHTRFWMEVPEMQKRLSRRAQLPSGFLISDRSQDMDKDTAKQIIVRMETCINLLSEVVQIAHANCGEHEDRVVRRGVGNVLSEIQDRL